MFQQARCKTFWKTTFFLWKWLLEAVAQSLWPWYRNGIESLMKQARMRLEHSAASESEQEGSEGMSACDTGPRWPFTASSVPSACLLSMFVHTTVDCWISNEHSYESTSSLVLYGSFIYFFYCFLHKLQALNFQASCNLPNAVVASVRARGKEHEVY